MDTNGMDAHQTVGGDEAAGVDEATQQSWALPAVRLRVLARRGQANDGGNNRLRTPVRRAIIGFIAHLLPV